MEQDFVAPSKYKHFFSSLNVFKRKNISQSSPEEISRKKREEEKERINSYIYSLMESENHPFICKVIDENIAFSFKNIEIFFTTDFNFTSNRMRENFIEVNSDNIKKMLIDSFKEINKADKLCEVTPGGGRYRTVTDPDSQERYNYEDRLGPIYQRFDNLVSTKKLGFLMIDSFMEDGKFVSDLWQEYYKFIKTRGGIKNFMEKHLEHSILYNDDFVGGKSLVEIMRIPLMDAYNHAHSTELFNHINVAKRVINQSSDIEKNVAISLHQKAEHFNLSGFPKEAKKTINLIKVCSLSLIKNIESLSQVEKLEFENLYYKKLPQVLQDYAVISDDYKKKLSSEKNNPDTLLTESLHLIKEKLDKIYQNVQQQSLHKMKIATKYLRNK